MKRIEAFLQPHRLGKVIHALHALPQFPGFTIFNAQGQGDGHGHGGHFAYDDDCLTYLDRKVLVVICPDAEAAAIARLIATVAHTGHKGDGIVVVSDVTVVVHIREIPTTAGDPA